MLDSANILHSAIFKQHGIDNADCNLGHIDFEAVQNEVETTIQSKKMRGTHVVYTPKECFEIVKYAVENETSKAVSRYKSRFLSLRESTVRGFKSKYENEIKTAAIQKRQPSEVICSQPRGRPTLLGPIDDMVQNYIRVSIFSF